MAGNKLKRELDSKLNVDDDLRYLVNDLSEAKHKAIDLAVQLGIKKATRDTIASSAKDAGDVLRKVLEAFLQGNGSEPMTRESIITALKSASVELPLIAQEIRKKYGTSPTGSDESYDDSSDNLPTNKQLSTPQAASSSPDSGFSSSGTSVENRERSVGESEASEDTGDNQDATSSGYESHRNDDPENQRSKPEGLKHDAQVFKEEMFQNLTKMKLRKMKMCYKAVLKHAEESFKRRNVSVQEVTETVDTYHDHPEVTALKGVSTMDGVWEEFKKHTKWYNSEVAEGVIDVLGVKQDRRNLETFRKCLRKFLRHLDSNPDQCRRAQITLKMEENFEHFSDKRLEQVCLTLCDLSDGTKPNPINVEEGCVKATFAIPIDVAVKYFPLSSSMERKFRKALPTLVRVNYSIPLELSNHSEDESTDKQTDCIRDEGFDELPYDASANESEKEELHQTAPKARTPKLSSHTRVNALRRGIALVRLIITFLVVQEVAINLGIFDRNFDGTRDGNHDRNLDYPAINVTNGGKQMDDHLSIEALNEIFEGFLDTREEWYYFGLKLNMNATDLRNDVQGERQGFDELPYDASASESEKEELHQTAPKARTPKLSSHTRVNALRRGDDSTAIQFIALPFMVFMIACLLKHYKNYLMLHLFVTRSTSRLLPPPDHLDHPRNHYSWPGNNIDNPQLVEDMTCACIQFAAVFVALLMSIKKLAGNTGEITERNDKRDKPIKKQFRKQCRKRAEVRLMANRSLPHPQPH